LLFFATAFLGAGFLASFAGLASGADSTFAATSSFFCVSLVALADALTCNQSINPTSTWVIFN